jgi:hypothetical protein
MRFSTRWRSRVFAGWAAAAVLALGLFAWKRFSEPLELDAPAPQVTADLPEPDDQEFASTIDALVTYNLATAVDSLEAFVPRTYGDSEHRLPVAGNSRADVAFSVTRSPFRVHVEGQTVRLSADVEYEGRVWYRPLLGPELSAGCGIGDAPRPRMRATFLSTVRLTPDWQLRTNTRLLRLERFSNEPRDRCRLTVLRIDVTDRVIESSRRMLERDVQRFDAAASRWPVRPKFEKLWRQLQRPIRLTDSVYLQINPYAAHIGALGVVDDTVKTRLRVIAAPRVVTGPRPVGERALPDLQAADGIATGAHVSVRGSFRYPVASQLLRQALVGRTVEQSGHRVRIRDVRLTGIGGGRVALAVTLSGRVRGTLYFTGRPRLDPVHHQVSVPDLDFDVGTSQLLVQGLGWLRGVDIRDFLRERARLPDSEGVDRLRALAESGVNRTLAPGVTLTGRIHDARGVGVYATTQEIRLRAVADAELTLAIDRAPAFPRGVVRAQPKDE